MLKKLMDRRTTARRHRIAMDAAWSVHLTNLFYGEPTTEDVINLAYGSHGIRLTETEARDALAAELARFGRRLNTPAA
ncbi:hypothetical protein [Streptomyces olivaceoviridis]|uniref:hypothetical protein n=1 Tax=Streptomyces olivaceoviridis TaxID=1921 RepID=UPI0036F594C5